jgi:hypothetical protein
MSRRQRSALPGGGRPAPPPGPGRPGAAGARAARRRRDVPGRATMLVHVRVASAWLFWSVIQTICIADELSILQTSDSEGKWTLIGARVSVLGDVQIPFRNSSLSKFSILTCDKSSISREPSTAELLPCMSRSPGSYVTYSTEVAPLDSDDSFLAEFIKNTLGHLPERFDVDDPFTMNSEGLKLFRGTELQTSPPKDGPSDSQFIQYIPGHVLSPLPWGDIQDEPPTLRWSTQTSNWLLHAVENRLAEEEWGKRVAQRGPASGAGRAACWRLSAADLHVDLASCRGRTSTTPATASPRSRRRPAAPPSFSPPQRCCLPAVCLLRTVLAEDGVVDCAGSGSLPDRSSDRSESRRQATGWTRSRVDRIENGRQATGWSR